MIPFEFIESFIFNEPIYPDLKYTMKEISLY